MIDVKIMAHPSRRENVLKILSELNLDESIVAWDDREKLGDAMYTAKKAWLAPVPPGCTHRLVLQDDIEVCDNFLMLADIVAEQNKDCIISFFHCEKYDTDEPYQDIKVMWGCGIMMPVDIMETVWNYIDYMGKHPNLFKEHDLLKDTNSIKIAATNNNIPIKNTVPSLVQHIGDTSLVGYKATRVAKDYKKQTTFLNKIK